MALKKCKECGHQISSSAKSCPQCGYNPKSGILHKQFGCGSTLVLVFVCFVLYFVITGGESGGSSSSSEVRAFGPSEALYLCQKAIKSVMKDPERTKVPYVQDFGSGDEMLFSWGRSTSFVRTRNGLGNDVPATASCTVSKAAEKINVLTVEGNLIYSRDRNDS